MIAKITFTIYNPKTGDDRMKKFNNYWPIYKNLEEETLQLTKYIQFSDDQLDVYSMHIADLIMRIAVEIEALSKELYKDNHGPDIFDENGKKRNLLFDIDCIKYLNDKWGICNREIMVSCSSFYFTKNENRVIKPLKRANYNGDKGAVWNRAYQAVKHDRRNNLMKGNIGNLIKSLGALYILNIYYRNDRFEYGTPLAPDKFFDNRLGSDIFSATFIDASKASIDADATDASIPDDEKAKLDSALCIIKYTDESWKNIHNAFDDYNNSLFNARYMVIFHIAGILTKKSYDDCQHIGAAIISECNCIISWNFKNIVNINTIRSIRAVTNLKGHKPIEILNPSVLLENGENEHG